MLNKERTHGWAGKAILVFDKKEDDINVEILPSFEAAERRRQRILSLAGNMSHLIEPYISIEEIL